MQSNRKPTGIFRRKPTLILTNKFLFTSGMELGEKGQLDVILRSDSEELVLDDDGNEYKVSDFTLIKAEKINPRSTRV